MSDELEHVGRLVREAMGRAAPLERRVASAWPGAVGDEIARNSQPRSLRRGRLVVATSSAVWAQTLQLMADRIRRDLNDALGEAAVQELVFRPAGWDPGGGAEGQRHLDAPLPWDGRPAGVGGAVGDPPASATGARRTLSDDEERAIAEVRRMACDEALGDQIARAMRAYLERRPG